MKAYEMQIGATYKIRGIIYTIKNIKVHKNFWGMHIETITSEFDIDADTEVEFMSGQTDLFNNYEIN